MVFMRLSYSGQFRPQFLPAQPRHCQLHPFGWGWVLRVSLTVWACSEDSLMDMVWMDVCYL